MTTTLQMPDRGFSGSTMRLDASIADRGGAVSSPSSANSGWDASNYSTRRGYVYFPQLNTQREVTSFSRLEMLKKARWLTRNVGFAKRCTRGLSQMVGYLSPRALTDDKEWNRLAESIFERRAGRANTFDRGGRFNVYSYQPLITSSRLTDGDIATILTSSNSGGAMVATYEGHQIGNGNAPVKDKSWRDGVRVFGERAAMLRVLDPEDANKATDIPSESFILHADYLSVGHSRGVTVLHHAINNMLDRTEVWSDLKLAIKIAGKQGFYISNSEQKSSTPRGMGEGRATEYTSSGDPVIVENLTKGGKMIELAKGAEIKQLLDSRPHPNSREFLEDLNRDIAYGIGNLSPEVLWNIAKLGGAGVRFVLAEAQSWVESQQQILVDQFLHRFWVYFIAKEIKAGRLREPTDPEWWWKVGWQPQAKLTVDIGKEGRLSIDLHRAGMLTLSRWYGAQGLDYEDELRQHVREYAMKMKILAEVEAEFGVKIDFDKVFPPAPGSAAVAGNHAGKILGPDGEAVESRFGDDEANVEAVLLEVRDQVAQLRRAA